MAINPNLINEDLKEEAYLGVKSNLEQIADRMLVMLSEKLIDSPKADERTIQTLGLLIEEKFQFTNHGPGISTLAKQAELFAIEPDKVVVDDQLDCKLPTIILGFATKALYQQLGITKQVYFGLGIPTHPHVLIEIEKGDGESEYLDIDYKNEKKKMTNNLSVEESTIIQTSEPRHIEQITESPRSDDNPFVSRRVKRGVDFVARKRNAKSYMSPRYIDNDTIITWLSNPRYKFKHFTSIEDNDFLRLLDTNFLRERDR